MIGRLRGTVLEQTEDAVILDVGGVGYVVHCPSRVLANLPRNGEVVDLAIETQVREDAITLFGFADRLDRTWFKALQAVQGVGARSALAILGVLDADRLATVIAIQDRAALTRAPGVGAKLAARICAELKDKAALIGAGERVEALAAPASASAAGGGGGGAFEDSLSALVNLGYGRAEAFTALQTVRGGLDDAAGVDVLLKAALKELAR